MNLFLLCLVAVFSSIVSGVIGLAGGTILISFMTFFLPVQSIVPIHGCIQLASNSSRAYFLRENVNKKIIINFVPGLFVGSIASRYILKFISSPDTFYYFLVVIIFLAVFRPKKLRFKTPTPLFSLVGFITGSISPLTGAVGPFLAPFMLGANLEKKELVATKAVLQTFTHSFKIIVFISLGFDFISNLLIILAASACTIIGSKIGTTALGKLSDKRFNILFKVFLLGAAARLIWKTV
jgi:uncharacterized protein